MSFDGVRPEKHCNEYYGNVTGDLSLWIMAMGCHASCTAQQSEREWVRGRKSKRERDEVLIMGEWVAGERQRLQRESIRRTRCSFALRPAAHKHSEQTLGGFKSTPLDVNHICIPDGLLRFTVFSDNWKSERLFYAHVLERIVSHWMSGLKTLVDLFARAYERHKLHGCTKPVGFSRSGVFSRLHYVFPKLIGVSRRWGVQPQRHRPRNNLCWFRHHIWIHKSPAEEKNKGKNGCSHAFSRKWEIEERWGAPVQRLAPWTAPRSTFIILLMKSYCDLTQFLKSTDKYKYLYYT